VEVVAHGGEALVEDDGVVGDVFAEIAKIVSHPLVAVTILGDGSQT
jgi:hypothetical protein